MAQGIFINAETGNVTQRELTDDELAAMAVDPSVIAAQAAAERDAARRGAYAAESDPLFFKWQRGESTEQAWRDKVDEIRQRYPDPS